MLIQWTCCDLYGIDPVDHHTYNDKEGKPAARAFNRVYEYDDEGVEQVEYDFDSCDDGYNFWKATTIDALL